MNLIRKLGYQVLFHVSLVIDCFPSLHLFCQQLNIPDDWIRTADLWCGKLPFYQLIHFHLQLSLSLSLSVS